MSKELLEYAPAMNDRFKVSNGTTKVLLRKLAQKYLPVELINQPKRGFEIPLKTWVNNDLKEIVVDYVGADSALSNQFIEKRFLRSLLDDKVKISPEKRAKILWTLLSMEVWYKKIYLA